VIVFYRIGGVGMVATALVQSYQAIPLAQPVPCRGCAHTMVVAVIVASAKLIESAVGLCAPALVSLLLTDLTLGVVGRATRISLFFIGMPLKALLGVGAVLVSVGTLDLAMQKGLQDFFGLLAAASRLGR
jgi:flagellar biosynthesis protein FliR